jgi:hypothetical protein
LRKSVEELCGAAAASAAAGAPGAADPQPFRNRFPQPAERRRRAPAATAPIFRRAAGIGYDGLL